MTSFSRPSFRLVIQLCFWILLMLSVSSIFLWAGLPKELMARNISILLGVAGLLWLNIYVLFPAYLAVGRYRRYLWAVIAACLSAVLLSMAIDYIIWGGLNPIRDRWPFSVLQEAGVLFALPPLFFKSLFFFSATTSSSLLEHIHLQQKNEQIADRIKAESAATELQFLKSQINPHFLLNALNNIYGLSIRPGGDNSEAVLQLSEMMRYVLYECNKPRVPVAAEINYIQHYIALQQLKDDGQFNVTCRYPISTRGFDIAPMLLIPLVENAFKHSQVENLTEGWIKIEIQTELPDALWVRVENSTFSGSSSNLEPGGIGLKNVRRRLELLYPNQHELRIQRGEGTFCVELRLAQKEKLLPTSGQQSNASVNE